MCKKPKKVLSACIYVFPRIEFDRETREPTRHYKWSMGIGFEPSPIPIAHVEGQSEHATVEDAIERARYVAKLIGAKVRSRCVPKVM